MGQTFTNLTGSFADSSSMLIMLLVFLATGTLAFALMAFVRVRGSWGVEVDSIKGYDVWNGRIVAVLAPSPRADSLLRKSATLLGVATRMLVPADTTTPAPDTLTAVKGCARDSVPAELPARVALVRDSLVRWVTDSLKPPYGLPTKLAVRGDTVSGCFGPWR